MWCKLNALLKGRISEMKKLLVCLMILALLVGCNGEKPVKEKVVTIQVPSDVISMDTQIATDGGSFSAQDVYGRSN